jgi:hypothetical protein
VRVFCSTFLIVCVPFQFNGAVQERGPNWIRLKHASDEQNRLHTTDTCTYTAPSNPPRIRTSLGGPGKLFFWWWMSQSWSVIVCQQSWWFVGLCCCLLWHRLPLACTTSLSTTTTRHLHAQTAVHCGVTWPVITAPDHKAMSTLRYCTAVKGKHGCFHRLHWTRQHRIRCMIFSWCLGHYNYHTHTGISSCQP